MRRRPAPASLPVVRLPFLEGLRGLAALYVVLSHFVSMSDSRRSAGKASHAPEWLIQIMSIFWHGNLAVASFIVLSGFCLQLSLFNRTDGKIQSLPIYFKRRARRILPPYYAALAFSIAVSLLVTQYQKVAPFTQYVPVTRENVIAHLLLVHNFNPDWMYKLNGVMWSIPIEAQLYILFPILVYGLNRYGAFPMVVLTASMAAAVIATVPVAPKLYPWYLALFTVGMSSAYLALRPGVSKRTRPWVAIVLGGGAIGGVVSAAQSNAPLYVQDPLIGMAVACLCYAVATTKHGAVFKMLSVKPLVVLGGFSYSLYLMHHPIQQIIYVNRPAFVRTEADSLAYLVVVGLPLILLGAYLFHLAFEKPFMPRRPASKQELLPSMMPVNLPLKTFAGSRSKIPKGPKRVVGSVPRDRIDSASFRGGRS